ncbi:MAG: hypothetical protein KGS10_05585 [Chloroflexi bacterium]|nr:hypothetical protein [Chloroflexota bacterium]
MTDEQVAALDEAIVLALRRVERDWALTGPQVVARALAQDARVAHRVDQAHGHLFYAMPEDHFGPAVRAIEATQTEAMNLRAQVAHLEAEVRYLRATLAWRPGGTVHNAVEHARQQERAAILAYLRHHRARSIDIMDTYATEIASGAHLRAEYGK